ncbi:hypothetical protein JWH06_07340 [Xanthomonas melonis]|uniref:DUF5655 domain-containing protein n=1 Tax=Xanthomonas melonis TaxID=56456 RepID=UPI001E600955|nr:DUF5655 domain-containing protein [Xanthomonas melonis]MCD0258000.1 hypothetical protein [Xanthomonas melonis]
MTTAWVCQTCQRQFTRKNQRHACVTDEPDNALRNRPTTLVDLYKALESIANSLGPIEFVSRQRYILLRSRRVFADVVVMSDALRLAIHLDRIVTHPLIIKTVAEGRQVTVVTKLRTREDLKAVQPLLREAYERSIA